MELCKKGQYIGISSNDIEKGSKPQAEGLVLIREP